ncbi:hypothetical protein B0A52_07680 [Exophiala mesophila]|uniref:Enoyl reductase (ER) domain-containing protein n=1 Tax=Exophiala mesophila TaxID=212818 RepID=A0A438MZQ1_EXOME|nr:hypothetical protein B0A52_07680 [Exophiala mesophila]
MKAIVLGDGPGKVSLVTDRPSPKLRPGYLGVNVKAVALNPTDWKHVDRFNADGSLYGCVSGCDYAGVVAETGTGYSKQWKVGDRICGFVHGGNELEKEDGGFAETVIARADIQLRIPDGMSFEDASTLGVGVITCAQALFMQMGLTQPPSNGAAPANGEPVLIYGGSSATGSIALQFARIAGYTPITLCSPHNFEFVKSLGAAAAFNYNDEDCVEQVNRFIGHDRGIKYVFDTISTAATSAICARLIAPKGRWAYVQMGTNIPRDDVEKMYPLAYLAAGERVKKGTAVDFPASKTDFDYVSEFMPIAESWLQQGILKPHPSLVGNGLEQVIEGMDLMRHGKVSGKKLVYKL